MLRPLPSSLHIIEGKLNQYLLPLVTLVGLSGGLMVAYLVTAGQWPVALGLLVALPAFVLLHRYPFAALIIWLSFTPFLMESNSGVVRRVYWVIHRALPPTTVAIILLSTWFKLHKRKLPKPGMPELLMAGYIAVSLLSILYVVSNNTVGNTTVQQLLNSVDSYGDKKIFVLYDRVFIPMCLYFILRLTKPKEADFKRLLPAIAFVLVSQSIIGILSWAAPQFLPSAWLNRAGSRTSGSLDHYSVFTSTVMLCSILLLQSAYNHNLHKSIRLGYIFLFILGVFMIFLSFSRASWLACIIVIIGLFFLYPKKMMQIGTFAIPVFIVLFSAGYLSQQADFAQKRFYSAQSEESALSRLPVVVASLRMFEARPLFGWGYGDFDEYDYQFQARVGDIVSPKQDHASHNLYLTVLAEQGIVGIFFYLMPVAWWLVLSVRAYPKLPAEGFWSRKLLVIFWLLLLFHFIINNFSNMRVVYGLGLWWIALGFIGVMVSRCLSAEANQLEARP